MQDFDLGRQQEREFRIAGETFRCAGGVRPEELLEWVEVRPDTAPVDALAATDRLIVSFLHGDEIDRWKALRERDTDPITMRDLNELAKWLVANETGRPTEAPSDSSNGRASTGTPSTETSSTEPAEAPAA